MKPSVIGTSNVGVTNVGSFPAVLVLLLTTTRTDLVSKVEVFWVMIRNLCPVEGVGVVRANVKHRRE